MRRLLAPILVVTIGAGLLASCGSDEARLSKSAFAKQTTALCKSFEDQTKFLDEANIFDLKVGAKTWAKMPTLIGDFLDKAKDVTPPKESQDEYDDYLDALGDAPDQIDDMVASAEDGDVKGYNKGLGELINAVDRVQSDLDEKTGTDCFDDDEALPQSQEPAEGAELVEVTAKEYTFDIPTVKAGKTALMVTNEGNELHVLGVGHLKDGATFEQLKAEIDSGEQSELLEDDGITGLAPPDGSSTTNAELKAGSYVAYCFIPAADGTPHLAMGMLVQFDVT
jgi:hypothetical protein